MSERPNKRIRALRRLSDAQLVAYAHLAASAPSRARVHILGYQSLLKVLWVHYRCGATVQLRSIDCAGRVESDVCLELLPTRSVDSIDTSQLLEE